MRLIDTFRLSTRMFKTNRLRTLLTILGIAVGIGTILFLVSLGYGLQKILIEQIASSDTLLSMDIVSNPTSLIRLDKESIDKIRTIPEITEVSPMFSVTGQMKKNNAEGDTSFVQIDFIQFASVSFLRLSGIKTSQGEVYKSDNDNKILISTAALKLSGLEIGKNTQFELYIPKKNELGEYTDELESKQIDKTFEISGVIDDDQNSFVYVPINAIDYLDIPYNQVKIKAQDQESIEKVKNQIVDMGFTVSALSDTIADANKIFSAIQIILSVFGAVALIVSAIGMFNTMTIALLERTQEIGIMKSLGASRRDIWKMFLTESVVIGFFGGAAGILIGYLGRYIFNFGINTLASSMGGQAVDLFYTPLSFVLFIIGFSTVVGFITGLYPAKRASQLNPLVALRYK